MKSGIAIKMKGGIAIMLGLLALAVAIFFHALSTRYQLSSTATAVALRLDSLTGQVCAYVAGESEFLNCTTPGN